MRIIHRIFTIRYRFETIFSYLTPVFNSAYRLDRERNKSLDKSKKAML